MVFSSVVFLFVFLPCVFLLYLVIPSLRLKNLLLTVMSLLFYAYGEPVYVGLMMISAFINYIFGLLVKKVAAAKIVVAMAVLVNIGMLGVFKYSGFIIENVNQLLGSEIPMPKIALPIGISFFTFQALSYVIDVYRKEVDVQRDFGKILLYISFFPQLIAGPIVKYHDIEKEMDHRKQTVTGVAKGIRRFIIGLSKKILIANVMGQAADYVFGLNSSGINVWSAWLGAISYTLQIYYDFSGYSDMAIGLGEMFGFHFLENFNYPYSADSIQDFWRRWHISLSTWFKEYLYIPLGGNRKGKGRTAINKMVVFFSTGLWHGASWNFVIWGMIHGTFLILEDSVIKIKNCRFRMIRHFYVMLVTVLTFVLFRAETLGKAGAVFLAMFGGNGFTSENISMARYMITIEVIATMMIGLIFSFPVKQKIEHKKWLECCSYVITLGLLLLCIFRLSTASYNPFIYFRF